MSLGAVSGSQIELDAIQDALQRGTLCVCAAGNDGGAVAFPAAFPEVVAVSAVGLKGTAPTGSLSATRLPTDPDKHGAGDLFLAEFSNFGNQVDCAAPGVGIISTVPERFDQVQPYAVMDGTSMASPAACGALAALLASSPGYQALTGSARAEAARTMLRNSAQSIGLSTVFQGAGMPQDPVARQCAYDPRPSRIGRARRDGRTVEMASDDEFVVAVKRDKRSEAPHDWVETVRAISGLTIRGEASPIRIQVKATPEAIDEVRRRLGEFVTVEKVMPRVRYRAMANAPA